MSSVWPDLGNLILYGQSDTGILDSDRPLTGFLMFTTALSRCSAFLALLICMPTPAHAADPATADAAQASVDPQVASDLVSTLENDAERQALIEKLKAL